MSDLNNKNQKPEVEQVEKEEKKPLATGQRNLSKKEIRNLSGKNREGVFARMSASEIVFKVISYVILTIFALICLQPFIYVLSGAITSKESLDQGQLVLFPIGFQIDALKGVFTSKSFWIAYSNAIFITLFGTIYSMGISILAAYSLSKTRMFGHKFFNFILVFTMWFSAGMIPVYLNYTDTKRILANIGITDTKWLIVLAMGFSAYNVIILRNAFQAVPKEIEEAALVDGANDSQILTKVFVPMSKASVATVALFYGVSRWNGYFWARQMADPTLDAPLQVAIRIWLETIVDSDYISTWNETYSYNSYTYAMVVCAIVPILIIYPFIQKYFAAGVNLGGVKE